ncbi:hydrolase [[Actinomadura] parvosata subsp. kistnae]|uniref:Alpha/beta hydrolase n=1 Tax=[Actinomadura] parvosata subsp. kistnae TaxID=1909395 RepID=A0A1V0A5U8_9ACTN|nr:alpha/beta hydrolase [Nonomuraea sp. ATCC 55076]AQZ65570.1 alpha/beta hydrolase [Nonomuraea sp. ATCC 55076]SPL96938.1 hydrolase [Actinomadura parvosata subsp. kistnae]
MKDLFWIDRGTGRPLVLLHGGFLDHGMWEDQIRFFAARHRVIAPDARGHGRSANGTEPYRLTDDLATLLRHLDTGPAVLVGVSMGAGTAVDTALEHPELVSALVVSGAGSSAPRFEDPWLIEVMGRWHAAMAAGDLDAAVEAYARLLPGPRRTLDDLDPLLVSRMMRMARSTMSKHSVGEPDLLVPVPGAAERVASIDVPVLAVHGAESSPDHIGSAEQLVRAVAGGRSVTIEGAAAYPNVERPDDYNKVLEEFLDSL